MLCDIKLFRRGRSELIDIPDLMTIPSCLAADPPNDPHFTTEQASSSKETPDGRHYVPWVAVVDETDLG